VRGIVSTDAEANIQNVFAAFFGFAYFDFAQAETLGLDPNPNTIGINLPDGASEFEIESAANEVTSYVYAREVNTTPYLLRRNAEIADMVGRFIVAMGLGAMLIGGVGIMNTMLVLVRRRSMEIAALKTFGLKGRQIGALFLSEAFLLGLIGSLVGIILGVLMSSAVNRYGEAFLQQKLPWKIYPEAVWFGLGLGLAVTMVFGVLPVLTATKVRPNVILRPNETVIPRAGIIQSLFALIIVVVVLGLIAGQIIGPVLDNVARLRLPSPSVIGILGCCRNVIVPRLSDLPVMDTGVDHRPPADFRQCRFTAGAAQPIHQPPAHGDDFAGADSGHVRPEQHQLFWPGRTGDCPYPVHADSRWQHHDRAAAAQTDRPTDH
jgi:hypothetical protein